LAPDNTTLRQFVWGQYIDELTQLKTYADTGTQPLPAGTYYPLQDLLYRTAATTNSSGNVVEAYDYDAYGNTLMYSGPGTDGLWFTNDDVATAQPACEFLFTGRQYDAETEIYFYRARYYQPGLGRFLGRDPLYGFGRNLYQYVLSSPLKFMDPFGLAPVIGAVVPCDPGDIADATQQCAKLGGLRKAICFYEGSVIRQVGNTTIETEFHGVAAFCANTGDCSAEQYVELRDWVSVFCKTLSRSCKGINCPCLNLADKIITCAKLYGLTFNAQMCKQARTKIMNDCFKGGDKPHKDEVANAQKVVDACNQKLADCQC
jgi:RHS repeat-associated protein